MKAGQAPIKGALGNFQKSSQEFNASSSFVNELSNLAEKREIKSADVKNKSERPRREASDNEETKSRPDTPHHDDVRTRKEVADKDTPNIGIPQQDIKHSKLDNVEEEVSAQGDVQAVNEEGAVSATDSLEEAVDQETTEIEIPNIDIPQTEEISVSESEADVNTTTETVVDTEVLEAATTEDSSEFTGVFNAPTEEVVVTADTVTEEGANVNIVSASADEVALSNEPSIKEAEILSKRRPNIGVPEQKLAGQAEASLKETGISKAGEQASNLSERLQSLKENISASQQQQSQVIPKQAQGPSNALFAGESNLTPAAMARPEGANANMQAMASLTNLNMQDVTLTAALQATGARAGAQLYTLDNTLSNNSSSSSDSLALNSAGIGKSINGAQTAQAIKAPAKMVPLPSMKSMALEIVHKAQAGQNRFEIRLDPSELGRVDVKLDFQSDNAVRAHLTVERPETLEMLQRDQKILEKMMQDAGLDLDQEQLTFELKDQEGDHQADENGENAEEATVEEESNSAIDAAIMAQYQNIKGLNGIDVRI